MKNNENGSDTETIEDRRVPEHAAGAEMSADDDTAELPQLDLADLKAVERFADRATNIASVSHAAASIMDVRGEVQRLQKRWELLDEKLSTANHRAASLQAEVDEKDAELARMVDDLDVAQQQIVALEATTVDRDAKIESLELALAEREEEIAGVSESLVEANSRASVFEDRLQAAKQEIEELRHSLQEAKSSEATLSAEKEAVFASQTSLRTKLQDLESYVEGRREKWIDQQAILKSHKAEISNLEAALASSESRFDERNATIESLQTRINELERAAGELEGRHKERGAAQQEAQELLEERIREIEQLKAELERARDNSGEAELEALTSSIAEKDESIRCLEDEIGKFEAVKTHIEEEQKADRKTINELQQDVAQLQAERQQLTESLDDNQARTRELAEKLDAAEQVSSELLDENKAQKERISTLEKELELRMEIIAGYNENAAQLNQLSRSMDAEADEHVETKLDFSDQDLEYVRHGKHALAAEAKRHAMVALSDASRTVYPISKPITTIGRSDSSDIRIEDTVISRLHALLQVDDDGVTIEDHGSKNGVLVNQNRIERATLKHGDVVSLGKYYLRYVDMEQQGLTH